MILSERLHGNQFNNVKKEDSPSEFSTNFDHAYNSVDNSVDHVKTHFEFFFFTTISTSKKMLYEKTCSSFLLAVRVYVGNLRRFRDFVVKF